MVRARQIRAAARGCVLHSRRSATLFAALLLTACAACSGGGGVPQASEEIGTAQVDPGTGLEFTVDAHHGGAAASIALLGLRWGRLVDVYSLEHVGGESSRVLRRRDYLVGEDVRSDGVDYELVTNPVTSVTSVTILHSAEVGGAPYATAFAELTANLGGIVAKGVGPTELPPFSFVPRNATVQLRFSDLLDASTIDGESLRVRTGVPPSLPFAARILPDPNFGGLAEVGGLASFRTTRVLVDPTITVHDALSVDPPLPTNAIGYPASTTTQHPSVAFFLPTVVDPALGIFGLLRNLSGATLAQSGTGLQEPGTGTVVRSFRAGGDPALTGDPNNGFLLDVEAPRLLGRLAVELEAVHAVPETEGEYRVDLRFLALDCALAPGAGDVLTLGGGVVVQVLDDAAAPASGFVPDVQVELLTGAASELSAAAGGAGTLVTTYTAALHGDLPHCFLRLSPPSPSAEASSTLLEPDVSIGLAFSEPMDPVSIAAFDTFSVLRELENEQDLENLVVGQVFHSADLREFRFVPVLPLDTSGDRTYHARLVTGPSGVTDLSGNAVADAFPGVELRLDPAAESVTNSGHVLRFRGVDEDQVPGGGDEIAGQFLIDPAREVVLPRPVARVSGFADRANNPVVSNMIPFGPGVQTPLVPLGSRLMSLYRYADIQWSSTDPGTYNMDVEQVAWAPEGGAVNADSYPLFEIALSHASKLPDEALIPSTAPFALLPLYPQSGLFAGAMPFSANALNDANNDLRVVHERGLGYVIDPADVFTNINGTKLIWWPLNRTKPLEDFTYYTWRDTAIQGAIGTRGPGLDMRRMFDLGLPGTGSLAGDVAPGGIPGDKDTWTPQDVLVPGVPSIGMPLLLEFKCFPAQDSAVGLNALDVSLAINSSARPNFRSFSSGGYNASSQPVIKNPDSESHPSGGYTPLGALTTQKADNTFYIGQLDFVVRVSRMHTRWFGTGDSPGSRFYTAVVEPNLAAQPQGTQVTLHFRGARAGSSFSAPGGGDGALDASVLDAYADVPGPTEGGYPLFRALSEKNPGVEFVPAADDASWKATVGELDGAAWFQVRVTFVNNAATGLSPELSALGVAHEGL